MEKSVAKIIEEAVRWAMGKVLQANHIPKAAGGPMTRFYTEYGKIVVELYFSQRRQEPFYKLYREVSPQIVRNGELILEIVSEIRRRTREFKASPADLFSSLIDPRVATLIRREKESIIQNARKIVELLDGLNASTEDLMVIVQKSVIDIDEFTRTHQPTGFLDRTITGPSLSTLRSDWCFRAQGLSINSDFLIAERNKWAAVAKMSPARGRSPSELRNLCIMLR